MRSVRRTVRPERNRNGPYKRLGVATDNDAVVTREVGLVGKVIARLPDDHDRSPQTERP